MTAPTTPGNAITADTVRTLRERGGTWVAYQNQALGSGGAGQVVCLRFGPGCSMEHPLDPMPDTPQHGPGWKYRVLTHIDAEQLPAPEALLGGWLELGAIGVGDVTVHRGEPAGGNPYTSKDTELNSMPFGEPGDRVRILGLYARCRPLEGDYTFWYTPAGGGARKLAGPHELRGSQVVFYWDSFGSPIPRN